MCLKNKIQLFILLDYVEGGDFLAAQVWRVSEQASNSSSILVNASAVLNCPLVPVTFS